MNSFPPPDFVPTESAMSGIEVYVPAPPSEERRPVVDFKCPNCGASTAYSVADGGLSCTYCGYYEPPQKAPVGKGAREFEFKVETVERAAHGWSQARRELECRSCGAHTSVPPDSLAHTCPFCGSNSVIQRDAPQDVLRPHFLIPFQLEAETCHGIFREWLVSSWLTPGELRQLADLQKFGGIYLPYWTFDAVTAAEWKAEVGHEKTERYYADGEWKTRTVTVWRWEDGHVRLTFDDVLVAGTDQVSALLLNRVDDYDLSQLRPYEPQYLAGFQARAYDVPLGTAWQSARQQIREHVRRECRDQASTSKIRNFSMNLDYDEEAWRYALLPVYLAVYTYGDRNFQVVVNGQTGSIAGQRPVAWRKIWLVGAALLVPGLASLLVGLVAPGARESLFTVAGIVLLAVGIVVLVLLIRRARALDDV